ncbi:MAG TPA: hypothetical protein PLS31_06345 [Candidatus Sumerlaeota bacterium]|nr:hypothetical protein [Candidatus Sumerlaeota bacterium]
MHLDEARHFQGKEFAQRQIRVVGAVRL